MSRPPEPSQSIPAAGSSTAQDPGKSRRRLTDPGRKLIQDYVDSVCGTGRKLTLDERRDLLSKIQALPGCEFYTLTNLNMWLQNHQYSNKPYRDKNDKNEAPRNSNSFPSLTPAMRAQLAALLSLEVDGDPAPAKISVWAGMLAPAGAARDEVLAWVQLMVDYANIKRRQAQRLPTPTSPTPAPASPVTPVSTVVSPSAPAPVVAYTGLHAFYTAPTLNRPTLPTRLGVKIPASSPTPGCQSPAPDVSVNDMIVSPGASRVPTLRESILQGVADAVSAPPAALPAAKPGTPDEFRALFAAYDAPLAQILCALET